MAHGPSDCEESDRPCGASALICNQDFGVPGIQPSVEQMDRSLPAQRGFEITAMHPEKARVCIEFDEAGGNSRLNRLSVARLEEHWAHCKE